MKTRIIHNKKIGRSTSISDDIDKTNILANTTKNIKTIKKINTKTKNINTKNIGTKTKIIKPNKPLKVITQSKYLVKTKKDLLHESLSNRYVIDTPNKKNRKRSISHISKRKLSNKSAKKSIKPTIESLKLYSGTIIYDGKNALHPYKWDPTMIENQPNYYKWETLLPGTHVLDKNTCITWIVDKNHSLSLAPCQTLQIQMNLPDPITDFNPGLCLSPYLPEKIPVGTRFIFKDSNQCYSININHQLELVHTTENMRPSQIIPIAINSLFNTQQLIGLNTMVTNSSIQKTTNINGYQTLESWLNGLIHGNDILPGYLNDLPKFTQLQIYDVLDFYDPNLRKNPKINNLNPDGTSYIEDLHESKYFSFRLQVTQDSLNRLTAIQITQPHSPFLLNINLPITKTDQNRPIYLRSAALIPYLGDPLIIINEIDNPYYLDSTNDIERLIKDFTNGLLNNGYPYQQIKISFLGDIQDFYTIRLSNLPNHIWGIVFSSDNMPHNKYIGSGRFFIGYSSNSNGTTYECELDIDIDDIYQKEKNKNKNEKFEIKDVTIDALSIKMNTDVVNLRYNIEIANLLNHINKKLSDFGYPGYVMNMLYNEYTKSTKFYLSGIINQKLPEIMFNINDKLYPLDFKC